METKEYRSISPMQRFSIVSLWRIFIRFSFGHWEIKNAEYKKRGSKIKNKYNYKINTTV